MARVLAGGTTCWPEQGCQFWVPQKDYLASSTFEMAKVSWTAHADWGYVHVYVLQAEENRPFSYVPYLPSVMKAAHTSLS